MGKEIPEVRMGNITKRKGKLNHISARIAVSKKDKRK